MKTLPSEVTQIEVAAIRPFIRRARQAEGWARLVASIAIHGLKVPIEVRDITDEPAAERKRPKGGHFKYELVKGEGRTLAYEELCHSKIPAYVIKAKQSEIVGRFLAENLQRKALPWAEKARLLRAEVDAGATVKDVARRFVISEGHAAKLLRVLSKTAQGIEDDVSAMGMNDAEVLTALPAKHQSIVVEVLRGDPQRQVRDIIRKAEQIAAEGQELSPTAVRQSLKRVDSELKAVRDSLKPVRLHHSLGPQNVQTLLRDRKFRTALEVAGVNIRRFQEISEA